MGAGAGQAADETAEWDADEEGALGRFRGAVTAWRREGQGAEGAADAGAAAAMEVEMEEVGRCACGLCVADVVGAEHLALGGRQVHRPCTN